MGGGCCVDVGRVPRRRSRVSFFVIPAKAGIQRGRWHPSHPFQSWNILVHRREHPLRAALCLHASPSRGEGEGDGVLCFSLDSRVRGNDGGLREWWVVGILPILRILVLVFGGQNRRNDLLKVYARTEVWVSYTFHGTPRALRVGALASIMQTSHRSGQRAYRAWLGTNADKVRSRSCRESKQED